MYISCLLNDYVAPFLNSSSCLLNISCQFKKQHSDQSKDDRDGVRGAGYKTIIKENARFEKYYQVRETGSYMYTCSMHMYTFINVHVYTCTCIYILIQ